MLMQQIEEAFIDAVAWKKSRAAINKQEAISYVMGIRQLLSSSR